MGSAWAPPGSSYDPDLMVMWLLGSLAKPGLGEGAAVFIASVSCRAGNGIGMALGGIEKGQDGMRRDGMG